MVLYAHPSIDMNSTDMNVLDDLPYEPLNNKEEKC